MKFGNIFNSIKSQISFKDTLILFCEILFFIFMIFLLIFIISGFKNGN